MAFDSDGKMKAPTVRNVDARPGKGFPKAFMHNGVFKTLAEVVHFYNTRDVPEENWPPPEVDRNVDRDILEGVPLGNLELPSEAPGPRAGPPGGAFSPRPASCRVDLTEALSDPRQERSQ
ncbi:MAG: hypothetical protein QNK03_24500 [Myxococcota bacterium]|nr:hypothetical protein [Myxococcota bacterium]